MWNLLSLSSVIYLFACGFCEATSFETERGEEMIAEKELIVVAAAASDDAYYAAAADDIFRFHIAYAKSVLEHDDFLVLTDTHQYSDYADAIGEEHVVVAPQADIWMRDFSLSNVSNPISFRYTPEGQGGGEKGKIEANHVQSIFAEMMRLSGLTFAETTLLNDGGNYVDDYNGAVVISRKFLRDNRLNEVEGRAAIVERTGARHVAFIEADEQGGLEHSDGVVAFLDPGVLVINSYPDDPNYSAQLKLDLRAGLPGVEIHEIVTPYDGGEIYDEDFGSACGLYTNMLVTPKRIYLPQFGIPEDAEAIAQIEALTAKQVIPVRSDKVCRMGGGVRCMSWQVRGRNAVAFKSWARSASR